MGVVSGGSLVMGCMSLLVVGPGCGFSETFFSSIILQVPFLLGVTALEKAATCVIHWIFRRTGCHLFLTDDDEGNPPLLRRMIEDCGELHFMYGTSLFLH